MKPILQQLIRDALTKQQDFPVPADVDVQIEKAKDASHGDFASNIALMLAKPAKQAPRAIAEIIVQHLEAHEWVSKVDIAGPGFINFTMDAAAFHAVVAEVLEKTEQYGLCDLGKGQSIHIEYVSANPTGPLHVGHGRGAAYGASLADLLAAAGYRVHREYYVNDAGRQMNILAASVWLRYLEQCGETIAFPSNGYQGDYVKAIAIELLQKQAKKLQRSADEVFANVPADGEAPAGDKEAHIDGIIANAQNLLGDDYALVFDLAKDTILDNIRDDLSHFGVEYQDWFSEKSLQSNGAIEQAIATLKKANLTYERDGALWFKATDFDDEKDRVLVRENGQTTYFASDVAYHWYKFEKGYDEVVDIWGADHHGYMARVYAAVKALGFETKKLLVNLVQFAILYRGEERVQMSTRSGSFVTLRELIDEVGKDAARFFYVMRKPEQHLDFDLELAKSQSSDNPVYYIQYAHARVCSVFRQADERGISWQPMQDLSLLTESHEQALMKQLQRYPDTIASAAKVHEPHQVAHFLRELANGLHTYYNAHAFLVDNADLCQARLTLIAAVRQVLHNGLKLLGVSAPETM